MHDTDSSLNLIQERLKAARTEKGYSLQKLADLVGISKSTLQRYESGFIRNLPLSKLDSLAQALGVSGAYLLGWDDDVSEKQFTKIAESSYLGEHALDGLMSPDLQMRTKISSDKPWICKLRSDEAELLMTYSLLSDTNKGQIHNMIKYLKYQQDKENE